MIAYDGSSPAHSGRLRVVFYAKKQLAMTPTEIMRNDVVPWRVSTRPCNIARPTTTSDRWGGLETVARVTRDLSSAVDRGGPVTALDALDQAPARQRLGFVFQCLGYDTPGTMYSTGWHAAATPYASFSRRRRHAPPDRKGLAGKVKSWFPHLTEDALLDLIHVCSMNLTYGTRRDTDVRSLLSLRPRISHHSCLRDGITSI